MKKVKIGIVGCGAIGKALAKFIDKELHGRVELGAICDLNKASALKLKEWLSYYK